MRAWLSVEKFLALKMFGKIPVRSFYENDLVILVSAYDPITVAWCSGGRSAQNVGMFALMSECCPSKA